MAKDKDRERSGRDRAGVGPDARQTRHLTPLKELDHVRVASGEPDIRDWSVYTSDGREIGEVEDLLVDTSRNEVVMIDIDLHGTERHTLAPIRAAWLDRDAKRVVLDGAQFKADEEIPSLSRSATLTDEEVRHFGDGYRRTYGDRALGEDEDDWRLRHRDDELRFGRRKDDVDPDRREVVVERRPYAETDLPRDERSDRQEEWHEVRFLPRDESTTGSERIVEEVVVRRRLVDADEADRIERENR
jgi:hypothetical protein